METELMISLETRPAQAPEWLCLLPLGEVTLGDGREPFCVDQEALEAMVRHFRARGLDLVIDYEHQTLAGGQAPAAGWIKDLEAREDGLWAQVEWTDAARSYLEAKEYRYFSPVLRLEKGPRRPLALLHAALTNTPAINHLSPLVAKSRDQGSGVRGQEAAGHVGCVLRTSNQRSVVSGQQGRADPAGETGQRGEGLDGKVQVNRGEDKAMRLEIREKKEETMEAWLEHLKHQLGLKPEAAAAEVMALADQRLHAAAAWAEAAGLLGLPEAASAAQVKGAILALQSSLAHLSRVQEELTALQSGLAENRALEAVAEALKAGKIQPAQQAAALKYARSDMEGFQTFVEKSLPVIPLGELSLQPDAGPGEAPPTSPEMAVCEALGITPEAFKAQERQLRQDRLL